MTSGVEDFIFKMRSSIVAAFCELFKGYRKDVLYVLINSHRRVKILFHWCYVHIKQCSFSGFLFWDSAVVIYDS